MIIRFHPRAFAEALLQCALRIAPAHVAEWGRAILGELHYVESDWAALAWAVGGASVLVKHALLSLIIPGQTSQTASSDRQFFAKENSMRKSTLISTAACLAASLLFFAAPMFREAFGVSLVQWRAVIASINHNDYYDPDPNLDSLVNRARANQDAEGLAFAAVHAVNSPDAAALADEAVRLNPNLTWVYATVAGRNVWLPQIDQWLPKLEQNDPENAVPRIIRAERIIQNQENGVRFRPQRYTSNVDWKNVMAAAFASPKFDPYTDRLVALDRNVASRYGINDPFEAESDYFLKRWFLGSSPIFYSRFLLDSGNALEARGDHQGAAQQYWIAARFGEMWQPYGGAFANGIVQQSSQKLATFYTQQGNKDQAQLFTFLAANAKQMQQDDSAVWGRLNSSRAMEHWNATIVESSGTAMLLCGAVLIVCVIVTLAKSRSVHPRDWRHNAIASGLGIGSAIVLLFSSVTLYLSYRPYAEIVHSYVRDGDSAHLPTLMQFLSNVQTPPGSGTLYQMSDLQVYFWSAIVFVCAVALVLTALRFLRQHTRAAAAA